MSRRFYPCHGSQFNWRSGGIREVKISNHFQIVCFFLMKVKIYPAKLLTFWLMNKISLFRDLMARYAHLTRCQTISLSSLGQLYISRKFFLNKKPLPFTRKATKNSFTNFCKSGAQATYWPMGFEIVCHVSLIKTIRVCLANLSWWWIFLEDYRGQKQATKGFRLIRFFSLSNLWENQAEAGGNPKTSACCWKIFRRATEGEGRCGLAHILTTWIRGSWVNMLR